MNQGLPDGTKASTRSKNFPLGRKYVGARHAKDSHPNAILNFIRQHGNYLLPGQGVNAVSLGAVILRAMFVSLVVYFAWLTLTMLAVISLVKGFNSLGLPIWFAWPAGLVDALKLEPSDQIFAE